MTVLFFSLAIVGSAPALLSQSDYETCDATITGENRNRYVAGDISAECSAGWTPHGFGGPWGNWGVRSNYGDIKDEDQFKGWKRKQRKYQWNSCTTDQARFPLGNSDYYNYENHTSQRSATTVQHGTKKIRIHVQDCPSVDRPGSLDVELHGCSQKNGFRVIESNYMEIKELDRPDGDSSVDRLEFPSTSITLRNCTEGGCTGGTTNWVDETSSEVEEAIVNAQLRMRVAVGQDNFCDIPY